MFKEAGWWLVAVCGCVWLGSHNLQEGPLATAHWGTMGSLQPTVGIRNYPRLDLGPRQPLHNQIALL